MPAATPNLDTSLRKPAVENGAPCDDMKINWLPGGCSRFSRRKPLISEPDKKCVEGADPLRRRTEPHTRLNVDTYPGNSGRTRVARRHLRRCSFRKSREGGE